MTANVLHISASPRLTGSHSRRIGDLLVTRLQSTAPTRVIRRDLAKMPPPVPDADFVDTVLRPDGSPSPRNRQSLGASEELINELVAADAIVIDTPIHNLTVPAVLKAWIDMVVRPGRTFFQTRKGKVGMIADRPVVLIVACGGYLAGPHARQPDFATPYLLEIFAMIGIRDVDTILLDGLNRGRRAVEAAERLATERFSAIADRIHAPLR